MTGGDAKFFVSHKKGEIAEWRDEINSPDKDRKKDAVKKVIAAMTVGKDVSMLFADVVNCMQTDNVELKKLVYLYLINYAKNQPDLAILAVNTFVKDTQDPNPLIRALAVRTMGCIRVDKITEYLCDPLQRALVDEDPYVRKTAAICVAKLFDINPELVQDRGFLRQLQELLADSNPMVVANAVAALAEVQGTSYGTHGSFALEPNTVNKLLAALNECTEWGQVFILESISSYSPNNDSQAESIIERVTPRLQHANCAVVLSAVKVIVSQLECIRQSDVVSQAVRKLAPPLVTLLSAESEIQFVALRNINLVIQRYPEILQEEIKVFFCKYNDPAYVKQEKLETMVAKMFTCLINMIIMAIFDYNSLHQYLLLAKQSSVRILGKCQANPPLILPKQVLLEFKEYATEVDVEFVRKSVLAIGRCAISIEGAAERCISVLLDLIKTKVNYVVQEAIVVIRDIFRRYPDRYEGVIGTLCNSLDSLDEPDAKASMVWIIGEYADRIDNAEELIGAFMDTFLDEASDVQLQLLTATVKLFLKKPSSGPQNLIQKVLHQATSDTDDPDLRDRAYIYWRLLSSDPEAAKEVVLASRPMITDDRASLDLETLQVLLRQVSTLSSVYYKLPSVFVPHSSNLSGVQLCEETAAKAESSNTCNIGSQNPAIAPLSTTRGVDMLTDLMDRIGTTTYHGSTLESAVPVAVEETIHYDQENPSLWQISNQIDAPTMCASSSDRRHVLLSENTSSGLRITGVIACGHDDNMPQYDLLITNLTQRQLAGFQFQFNKNSFMLAPYVQPHVDIVSPGESRRCIIPLSYLGVASRGKVSPLLQVAVKSLQNDDVFYFNDQIPLEAVTLPDSQMEFDHFVQHWQSPVFIFGHKEKIAAAPEMLDPGHAVVKLKQKNISLVSQKSISRKDGREVFFSGKVKGVDHAEWFLLQLDFQIDTGIIEVVSRSSIEGLAEMAVLATNRLMSSHIQ